MDAQAFSLAPLPALILASAIVMGSPGPSTTSMTAVGAAFGFRASLGYMAGAIVGTLVVLIAVAAGLVAALLSVPRLASTLTAASAIYILWLAFRIATAPPLSDNPGALAAPSFAGGFLLGVANPKAYLAIAAVFAGSTLAEKPALDAALKVVVLSVMIVIIHVVWLLAGAALSRVLCNPVGSRIVNVVLALALVATTVAALIR